MTIRDLAALELSSRLDELLDVCKRGGSIEKRCPNLSADVRRKANALKLSLEQLRKALDEAGPPPRFAREMPPLYLRQHDPVIQAIARLLGHHGVLEDTLFVLTKDLAAKYDDARVSDAVTELVWIDRETRWARLRPEVIRSLRPVIGPVPGADDCAIWWKDRGGPPEPRSPATEKQKRQAKEEKPTKKPALTTDVTPEQAAEEARAMNKTSLLAMLRRARKDLKQHGEGSWAGRQAKKRLLAAEAELKRRGIEVPPGE